MFKYLFFICQFSTLLFAQNYLWPTNASKHLTSSFCEYRPGHYHSAIDIKTWNKEGYKCFAVEDGKIERIKIQPYGGGKALYIRLKDGRRAVYYHLQKFASELENKVREIQLAQKRYSIEWWPKNWPVKKGEFVAYTGQTGIGVPHLHFEIRDKSDHPLNPLQFYPHIKDNIRPQLRRLLVIPQDKNSRVNGSFLPGHFTLTYIHDGVYIIKDPVYVKGKVGLALNGYDMANGVSNKFAWYKVSLTTEGKKIFEYAYDRLSFKNTRYVDVDIYYPEKRKSGQSYNKLYLEPFNILSFYNRNLGNGLINITNTAIPFEIEARDYYGNTSIVSGTLLPEKKDIIEPSGENKEDKTAYLKVTIPDNLKNIKFSSGHTTDSLKALNYFEIINRHEKDSTLQADVKVRLASYGDRVVRSVVENENGEKDTTVITLNKNGIPVKADVELMGKFLYFRFNKILSSENPRFYLVQGKDTTVYSINKKNDSAECVLSANDIKSDTLNVSLQDDERIYFDSTFTVYKMIPGQLDHYSLLNDFLKIDAGTTNAFDTLFFNAKITRPDSAINLPVLSKSFAVNTGDHILNSYIDMSVKIDSTIFNPEQVAFYSVDDDLDYEGGNYDPQTGFVTTRVKDFSTFVVAADTNAPSIELINFRSGGSYKSVSQFRFKVVDKASGIGTDKNIEVYLDDHYLVPEWDPERDMVKCGVYFKPDPGKHVVSLICKDRAGNIAHKIIPINIL